MKHHRFAVIPAMLVLAAGLLAAEPFTVAEHGPTGTVPHENLEGGMWVLFSGPAVAMKNLEKPASSSTIMKIDPPLQGVFRWYGSRLYAFEPSVPLAPATQYTVSVSQGLKSLDGRPLAGDRSFTFRTEPLQIVSVAPSGQDVTPEECERIIITFNFPVDLAVIAPSLKLEAAGKAVPFKVERPRVERGQLSPYENADRLVSLSPAAELPRDRDITVRVLPGAKPRRGAFGSTEEMNASFHTLKPFAVAGVELSADQAMPGAALRFNHAIRADSAKGKVDAGIRGYSTDENMQVQGDTIYLSRLPVPFESSFTVRVLPGIEDVYGQALPAEQVLPFDVGPAPSYVVFHGTGQKLLESQFPPVVVMEMQNVDSAQYSMGSLANPFLPLPSSTVTPMDVTAIPRNTRHFEHFDLLPYLNRDGKGAAFLSWDLSGKFWGSEEPEDIKDQLVVQVTDIGASLQVSATAIVVQANSLSTGAPLAGASVILRKGGAQIARASAGPDGLVALGLPRGVLSRNFSGNEDEAEVEISKGSDRIVLRPTDMPCLTWNSYEPYSADIPRPVTYMWSDRGIYRPGETVSYSGTDRDLVLGKITPVSGAYRVEIVDTSHDERPIAFSTGTLTPEGGFAGAFKLPASLDPGDYALRYSRAGKKEVTGRAEVRVALFRRLSFSLDVAIPDGRWFMGDTLTGRFSGSYLAGGALTRGTWSYWWTRREVPFSPPGEALAGYQFGHVEKDWPTDLESAEGSLGGDGAVTANQKLADGEKGRVYSYELTATVTDVDRQALSRQKTALAFTSALLLGAKITASQKSEDSLYFVRKGDPFTLKVAAADPDGNPYPAGAVQGRLVREEWTLVRERGVGGTVDTHYEKKDELEKEFTTAVPKGKGFASVPLSASRAGSYAIELEGKDADGRESYTRISFYVTGSDEVTWQRADEQRIELVADKQSYRPGDKAKILVKSPLARGSYLVTVERDSVLEKRTVQLEGGAPVLEIDIKEEHVPAVYVFVSTSAGRTQPPPAEPGRPDFGKPRGWSGLIELPVDTSSRRITLAIERSRDSYRPGTDAALTVTATLGGKPVEGAEIALVAADRGVLDLIDYHVPSPLEHFYGSWRFPDRVAHYDTRDLLLDPVTWKTRDLPGGDEKGEAAPASGPGYATRKDFNPTALFKTGLVTGRDGKVKVSFKLPDQLTRFRTTAVVVKGDLFGIAEGELLVQNPLNVRAALPRGMRTGDAGTAGVIITNLDSHSHKVSVAASAEVVTVRGEARKVVTLDAGATEEVAFDLLAPAAGAGKVTFTVDSDVLKEKLQQALPVEEAALAESFAIAGRTADSVSEGIVIPAAFAGSPGEGLSISMDSTAASALSGAVQFLRLYPYDCLEQRTSKLFAYILFPWLITEKGASPDTVAAEMKAIPRYANPDGGFSYWENARPRRSDYYVTLRVAHLVAVAREHKVIVPPALATDAILGYLAAGYDKQEPYLKAYALYALARLGHKEKLRADALWRQGDSIGVFGYGFLGLAYQAMGDAAGARKVLARLKNFMRPGTRTVTLVGTVNDYLYYGGSLQAKALLLMLYAKLDPGSPFVQALATDLLLSNRGGHWANTSNAGWVLQAFSEIIEQGKERDADFQAAASLGSSKLAAQRFRGLSRRPFTREVSPKELLDIASREKGSPAEGGTLLPFVFSKQGKGNLYYTALLKYGISPAAAEPRDEGIGLSLDIRDEKGRRVEGTDLPAGKAFTARIVLYSSKDRDFLALRVPIPSGAEPIDGSLAATQILKSVPPDQSGEGDTEGEDLYPGFTTRMYDNEVRFFFDSFPRGKSEVSFSFRTTTPGVFPTPPVQAELMYQGEVFGRTAGTVYRIVQP